MAAEVQSSFRAEWTHLERGEQEEPLIGLAFYDGTRLISASVIDPVDVPCCWDTPSDGGAK